MINREQFWSSIKNNLKSKNQNNRPLQMWFEPTKLVAIEDRPSGACFRLSVPTELHRYWISQNLLDRICSEISALYANSFQVELVVTPQPGEELMHGLEEPSAPMTPNGVEAMVPRPATFPRDGLNPDYTFSTFVVGRNNEFAHAACYSVAENPGTKPNNPLFICGPTGMGKTHLLNAVGNHYREAFPQVRINYVSAEKFLNDCISSIRRSEMDRFRQRYRENSDILLMDDIQVLGRGEAVQEEFFHTLNSFFERGKQVVVASDRMPRDIKGLEDRIRTRLEWGLIADIQMPDIETRVAILKYKAELRGIRLPSDVIGYVARISKRSVRELEGSLNKLKMYSDLQGIQIDMDLAKKVLSQHDDATTITIEEIQRLVSEHFQVRIPDLKSKTRTKPLVTARQIAMFLIKKHLEKPLVDIGRAFGGKDHTTVINALRRIEDALTKDSEIKKDIEDLESRIHNITGV